MSIIILKTDISKEYISIKGLRFLLARDVAYVKFYVILFSFNKIMIILLKNNTIF